MNRVLVTTLAKRSQSSELKIKKLALQILKILSRTTQKKTLPRGHEYKSVVRDLRGKVVTLEVFLASSKELKHFNKKYRNKNKPANVLSFKEPKGFFYPDNQRRIGEIFLNIEAVFDKEKIALFLVHGILHLFGYEHKTKDGRIRMEKREQSIIKNLKLKI